MKPLLHYTDEEKIKRLSAWHESEKKEIDDLRAQLHATQKRVEELERLLKESHKMIYKLQDAWMDTKEVDGLRRRIRALLKG